MSDEELPPSPISALMVEAISAYALLQNWMEAGFTREESMDLLKVLMQTQIMTNAITRGDQ